MRTGGAPWIPRLLRAGWAALALSCALPQARPSPDPWSTPVADPTTRVEVDGFSVLPPNGSGWYLVRPPSEPTQLFYRVLTFGKRADTRASQPQTTIASANTWDLGEEAARDSPEDYLKRAERLLTATPEKQVSPRHRIVSSSVAPAGAPGAACLAYRFDIEDTGVPGSPGIAFVLTAQGSLCRHPRWPRYAIEVGFSQRYPKGQQPQALDAEVQPFLKGLVFSDTRPLFVTAIAVGDDPQAIGVGTGAVWTAFGADGVARIDPRTNEVVGKITVDKDPVGLAVGFDAVWVVSRGARTVSRIDPATNRVTATVPVGKAPLWVAVGAGAVWVTNGGSNDVSRIDPASNTVVATIPVGREPSGIVESAGSIWVASFGDSTVSRIDPERNRVTATIRVGGSPGLIASGEGGLWVACQRGRTAERIDPQANAVAAVIPLGKRPTGIAVVGSTLWLTNYDEGSIVAIDAGTHQALGRPIAVGTRPMSIVAGAGSLWVTNSGGRSVSRLER